MQAVASLRPVCHLYPYSTVALPVIGVLTEKSFCTHLLMEGGCRRDSGLDIVLFVEAKMLKTEENKWNEEEMKPYSNFQPKHIIDQDKHIFSVWEWHCLSAVVTHSFLLYFPTGSVLGQQSDPSSPSFTQVQLPSWLGFHFRRSQPAWAGGCQEQKSHPSPCATSQAFACLEAELATALLCSPSSSPLLPRCYF